jgi:hypothetical protein
MQAKKNRTVHLAERLVDRLAVVKYTCRNGVWESGLLCLGPEPEPVTGRIDHRRLGWGWTQADE